MFDNPKKELERLQEQLLAAERHDPVDDLGNEFMDESEPDDILDDELFAVLYDDQKLSRRSVGFDIQEPYVMDSDRYVAVPKKKKKWLGNLLFAILLIVLAAATLIGRWQGWL